MNRYLPLVFSFAFLTLVSCGKDEQSGAPAALPFDLVNTPVGDVSFPVGCNAEAAPLVERGVALLHHMMYDEARFVFGMADDRDPDCAMAYWGAGDDSNPPTLARRPDRATIRTWTKGSRAITNA